MPIKKSIKKNKIIGRRRGRGRRRIAYKSSKIYRSITYKSNYSFRRRYDQVGSGPIISNTANCMPNAITAALGSYTAFGMEFKFSYVNNYGEFTVLFDQYRLNKIVCEFKLRTNPESATSAQSGVYPEIWWAPDHDDSLVSVPAAMRDYQKLKHSVLRPNRIKRIVVKPNVLAPVYRSITNNYAPSYNVFVDSAAPDTPHYGLKGYIQNLSSTVDYVVDMDYIFYFTCKQVR